MRISYFKNKVLEKFCFFNRRIYLFADWLSLAVGFLVDVNYTLETGNFFSSRSCIMFFLLNGRILEL